jgi:hypothetical protein
MMQHVTATTAALVGVHLATRYYVAHPGVLCLLALWALNHGFETMFLLRNDVCFVAVWAGLAWAQLPLGVLFLPGTVRMLPPHLQPVDLSTAILIGLVLMPAQAGWQILLASLIPDLGLILVKLRKARPMGSPSFD